MPMNPNTETANGNDMKTIDIIGWGFLLIVAGFSITEISYWLQRFELIPTIIAGFMVAAAIKKFRLIEFKPKRKKQQSAKAKATQKKLRELRAAQKKNGTRQ